MTYLPYPHVVGSLMPLADDAQGEWLGWLWPLFVDHIRREEDYFLGALQGT